jgi:D-amino-acid dehydrogenase
MRPATPKGTPVLGATPHANLWLNVGHGALGFTLALAAGRVIADLAAGRTPRVPLEGFTLH